MKDCRYKDCIVSVGEAGSKWMEQVCHEMDIPTKSNRVDIGVRVGLPAVIFSHLTDYKQNCLSYSGSETNVHVHSV